MVLRERILETLKSVGPLADFELAERLKALNSSVRRARQRLVNDGAVERHTDRRRPEGSRTVMQWTWRLVASVPVRVVVEEQDAA
jgi:predicted ArsR family transcriptional regulator